MKFAIMGLGGRGDVYSHFIKELGDYFRPHTHKYVWKFIKGAWRLVKEIVLPY